MKLSKIRVAEALSCEFGCVGEGVPVKQLVKLMLENHWNEVMVTSDAHNFCGMITKERLMKKISDGVSPRLPVKEICCRSMIYSHEEDHLDKARDIMRRDKVGRLPVLNRDGQITGMLTSMEVCNGFSFKLETLGNYMQVIMDNITEAIQVIDGDGMVTFWNNSAGKLFGIEANKIIGRNLADFFPDDIMLQVLKTSKLRNNIFSKQREGVYVIRNVIPILSSDGENLGVVCTTLDVSDAKVLIEKLEQTSTKVKALESRINCKKESTYCGFYTTNMATKRILEQGKRVGHTNATILIQGESGTGKELLANVIYRNSKRKNKPFIDVNCSAIPENLFESEMFGYEQGAFTGGSRSGKPGKMELANGGTLFLDEIGDLPLGMQAKLLRGIQEQRFYKVGGTTSVTVDVRVIAATNQNLLQLIEQNKFREDLYYRLSVVTLEIPPLRQRKDDIPGLVDRAVEKLSCMYEREIKGVDQKVLNLFMAYDWPGNVRQLHNMIEGIIILMQGDYITVNSLSEVGVLQTFASGMKVVPVDKPEKEQKPVNKGLNNLMKKQEREIIFEVMEDCELNKAQAAKLLGIPRSTLYYKMKSLSHTDD